MEQSRRGREHNEGLAAATQEMENLLKSKSGLLAQIRDLKNEIIRLRRRIDILNGGGQPKPGWKSKEFMLRQISFNTNLLYRLNGDLSELEKKIQSSVRALPDDKLSSEIHKDDVWARINPSRMNIAEVREVLIAAIDFDTPNTYAEILIRVAADMAESKEALAESNIGIMNQLIPKVLAYNPNLNLDNNRIYNSGFQTLCGKLRKLANKSNLFSEEIQKYGQIPQRSNEVMRLLERFFGALQG